LRFRVLFESKRGIARLKRTAVVGRIRYPHRAVLCLTDKFLFVPAIDFGWKMPPSAS